MNYLAWNYYTFVFNKH